MSESASEVCVFVLLAGWQKRAAVSDAAIVGRRKEESKENKR